MKMNTAKFNQVVAEAMAEIKGIEETRPETYWEIEREFDATADLWWDDEDDFEPDWECLRNTEEWLIAHIDEYDTEEYRDTCGFYSDYYKDCNGIRPHWFFESLYEEHMRRQGE